MSKTIRRINYVGEDAEEYDEPIKVKKKPGRKPTMTPEEAIEKKRKTALDYYHKHKVDEEFMEKRRVYATEHYQRKKKKELDDQD